MLMLYQQFEYDVKGNVYTISALGKKWQACSTTSKVYHDHFVYRYHFVYYDNQLYLSMNHGLSLKTKKTFDSYIKSPS